jgi:hypothetical protein
MADLAIGQKVNETDWHRLRGGFHHLSSSPPPQRRNADHAKGRMLIEKLADSLESQQKKPPVNLGKRHKREKVNLS